MSCWLVLRGIASKGTTLGSDFQAGGISRFLKPKFELEPTGLTGPMFCSTLGLFDWYFAYQGFSSLLFELEPSTPSGRLLLPGPWLVLRLHVAEVATRRT